MWIVLSERNPAIPNRGRQRPPRGTGNDLGHLAAMRARDVAWTTRRPELDWVDDSGRATR